MAAGIVDSPLWKSNEPSRRFAGGDAHSGEAVCAMAGGDSRCCGHWGESSPSITSYRSIRPAENSYRDGEGGAAMSCCKVLIRSNDRAK